MHNIINRHTHTCSCLSAYTLNFASGLETSALILEFVLICSPFIHSSFISLCTYSQI